MKIKPILFTIQYSVLILFLITSILGGYRSLAESHLWIAYTFIVIFTLPSLISKVLFQSTLTGVYSVLSFLYYPITYFISYAIATLLDINILTPLSLLTIFTIVIWNILLSILIKESNQKYLFWLSDKTITPVITSSIIISIIFLVLRQIDSVIALDYLQHQAVVNNMTTNNAFCVLPGSCSSLFLQNGYTTIFHTIWGAFTTFTGNNLIKSFFIADILWPILMGLITFKLALKIFKNDLISSFIVAFSTLTFVNGAYEFSLLIPQTFTFYLFLQLLSSKKLNLIGLILGSIFLILTHFVMGSFLVLILIFKILILKKLKEMYGHINKLNFVIYIFFLVTALTLLLNISGFSFESYLQQNEIEYIGGETNQPFPLSLEVAIAPLGVIIILLIVSILYYFNKKQKSTEIFFAITYICINFAIFFLGPTYANKFMIGLGIFSGIVIANYLKNIKVEPKIQLAILLLLILNISSNFYVNFQGYLKFYQRENNIVSALSTTDEGLINYLKTNNLDCYILSDPFTQIIIAGTTSYQTATGQYMSIEGRETLLEFITKPNVMNLLKLRNISDLKNNNFCFIYSSRLEESIYEKNIFWTQNVYTLPAYNDYGVNKNEDLINFMEAQRREIIYRDNNYILFNK